jgi:hypothetical protein
MSAAGRLQMGVHIGEAERNGYGDEEVSLPVADDVRDVALLVAPPLAAEVLVEQEVVLEPQKLAGGGRMLGPMTLLTAIVVLSELARVGTALLMITELHRHMPQTIKQLPAPSITAFRSWSSKQKLSSSRPDEERGP